MSAAPVNLSLAGLRALVTAGASGIGLAIAEALIAGGARVHICDISGDFLAEFRKSHAEAGASRADVASEADVERLFIEVEKNFGGLDVLVNNAGIAGPTGGIDEIAPADPPAGVRSSTCLRPPVVSAMRFARLIPPLNGVSSA